MHAQRDIVLPNCVCLSVCLSVRPSVSPMLVLRENEWTYRHTFLTFWYGHQCSIFGWRFGGAVTRWS